MSKVREAADLIIIALPDMFPRLDEAERAAPLIFAQQRYMFHIITAGLKDRLACILEDDAREREALPKRRGMIVFPQDGTVIGGEEIDPKDKA